MKTAIYVLFALTLILWGVAAALWLSPAFSVDTGREVSYGLYEGRRLVERISADGGRRYAVEDADGNMLFNVPVRNCLLDVRFRGGRLRFREKSTGRVGYIDRDGIVAFPHTDEAVEYEQTRRGNSDFAPKTEEQGRRRSGAPASGGKRRPEPGKLGDGDLRRLGRDNPFRAEAAKVLSGRLDVDDAERRRVILNYCEHFRAAYVTKDIDFLRQVFSDNALIIVGNVVRPAPGASGGYAADGRVEYYLRTKDGYLSRLRAAFAANRRIDVNFSDFRIMRHPTVDGIYGVSLRQRYAGDKYSDDGWLFLLWDFRDEAMPLIHVRTWQPAEDVEGVDDVISIGDFNLR